MVHANPAKCPFCPENGKVDIIAEAEDGYLTYVLDGEGRRKRLRFFIIPKAPIERFDDLPDDWTRTMKYLVRELNNLMEWENLVPQNDWNLNLNIGPAAGQQVAHLHFWIAFRFEPVGSASKGIGLDGLITKVNEQAMALKERDQTIEQLRRDANHMQPGGFNNPHL